jgi:hypothetical protein
MQAVKTFDEVSVLDFTDALAPFQKYLSFIEFILLRKWGLADGSYYLDLSIQAA